MPFSHHPRPLAIARLLGLTVLLVPLAAPAAPPWDVADTARAGQRTIYGRTAGGSELGLPVAVGDLNGDRRGDVIITPMNANSGPNRTRTSAGEAIVVFSSTQTDGTLDLAALDVDALPATITVIYGADAFDYLGCEVFAADLNGDGFDDILLGAQHADGPDGGRPGSGEVYIVWGSPTIAGRVIDLKTAAPGEAVTVLYGAESGDRFGTWMNAGDFDGDGHVDALIGADQGNGPGNTRPHAGETYVLYGGPALRERASVDFAAPATDVTTIYGIDPEDHSGCTLRGADLNRDGAAELLIGAGLNRLSSAADGTGGLRGHGTGGGDGPNNDRNFAGEAYVVYGVVGSRPAAIDLAAPPVSTVVIYGRNGGDAYGEELFAGDFNGDGFGDVAVGALTADGPNNGRGEAGEIALLVGGPDFPGSRIDLADIPPNATFVYGAAHNDIAGDTALMFDLDGDGLDDLAIGSPRAGSGSRITAGDIAVVFGSRTTLPAEIDLANPPPDFVPFFIQGNDLGDMLAYSAAFGDTNGDGRADLVFNAMAGDGFDNLLTNAGDMYVLDGVHVEQAAERGTATATPTPTSSPVPSATPSATASATHTPVTPSPITSTATPTATAVNTPTASATEVAPTATVPPSPSATSPPTATATRSVQPSPTASLPPSPTRTVAPPSTATAPPSATAAPGGGNDGCAIAAAEASPGTWWLFAFPVTLWISRRRRPARH